MCKPIEKIRGMSAPELLEYCGQKDAVPVSLSTILKTVGISAIPYNFSEMETSYRKSYQSTKNVHILGAIAATDENAAIFYNEKYKCDSHRCRFTIAHELAHCCLANDSRLTKDRFLLELRTDDDEPNDCERAANVFAGELLIPKTNLYDVIDQLLLPSVYNLAKIFDVSYNVMLERLDYLKPSFSISGYNY